MMNVHYSRIKKNLI